MFPYLEADTCHGNQLLECEFDSELRSIATEKEDDPLFSIDVRLMESQGLTYLGGCVIDFQTAGGNRPASKMGLAFVGMSRCTDFKVQGFKYLPDLIGFREVLADASYRKGRVLEQRIGALHAATVQLPWVRGSGWESPEDDIKAHIQFS